MRPLKAGLDYFPLDVELDKKYKLFRAKYKLAGIGFIDCLFREIYKNGYFLKWDSDSEILFADEYSLDQDQLKSMLDFAIIVGFFDSGIFQRYNILTSAGIQKRFFDVAGKRKSLVIFQEILLTEIDESDSLIYDKIVISEITPVKSEITQVNPEITPVDSDFSTQRKGKERKEKESKEKQTKLPPLIASQSADATALIDLFLQTLPEYITVKIKQTDKMKWGEVFDGLIKDGYLPGDIKIIIDHFRADAFWAKNFLSPAKLRTKTKDGILYIDYFANKIQIERNTNGNGKIRKSPQQLANDAAELAKRLQAYQDSKQKLY
jgi:hypothetical protein